jgi:hypothetical protein
MDNSIQRLFVEPFQRFYDNLIEYLPKIMGFVLIFVAGLVLGRLLRIGLHHVLKLVKTDSLAERLGVREVLMKGGIREPVSLLAARVAGWLTVFVFFIIALDVLEVPEVGHLLRTTFLYLPNLLAAGVIVFLGYLLSNFLGRAALITCVNADVKASGSVGRLVKLGVFILAATMALEQLGIGKETIIVSYAIVFGGIVLALAIAFGLGGRDAAREFIERKLGEAAHASEKSAERDDEISHI